MKRLEEYTNEEKARLLLSWFPEEIPGLLGYMKATAQHIATKQAHLRETWNAPLLSFGQWLLLATTVSNQIDKWDNRKLPSPNVIAGLLFGGYEAFFSAHCVQHYGLTRKDNEPYQTACRLFFL